MRGLALSFDSYTYIVSQAETYKYGYVCRNYFCIPDFQNVVKWGVYIDASLTPCPEFHWRCVLDNKPLRGSLDSSDNPLLHFRIQNEEEKKSVTTLTLAENVKSLVQ